MCKEYVKYRHHGHPVWVRKDLRGEHRNHCLCFECEYFNPDDREDNCHLANVFFALDVLLHMTTPVWECPTFRPKEGSDVELKDKVD